MKVCIFSPYFKDMITGGGEKHLLEMALVISQKHRVQIAVSRPSSMLKDKETSALREYRVTYEHFLNKKLSSLEFIFSPLMTTVVWWKKLWWTGKFDYLMAVTDGSLFFSLAKTNNLHLQVPFIHKKFNLIERAKLANWQIRNANSKFTQQATQKSWRTQVQYVVYPLIDADSFSSITHKQKIILGVGRFYKQLHAKRQDVMIKAFKKMIKQSPDQFKGWQLVLIGAPEDENYVNQLKQMARGLPIHIKTIVSKPEVVSLMNKAKIFWHATGFGINEVTHPEQVEHFGIVTAEAMAAGAVPLVYYAGGQKEVLGPKMKDLGWLTESELIGKTKALMADESALTKWQALGLKQVAQFGPKPFATAIWHMMK